MTLEVQLTSFDLDQVLFSHPPVRTPVGGRVVRLRLGDQKAQVTTDSRGIAAVTLTIQQRPSDSPVPLLTLFDGDGEHLAIEAPRSSVRVLRESTDVAGSSRWSETQG